MTQDRFPDVPSTHWAYERKLARLPKQASDLIGRYQSSSGFSVAVYDLCPNGVVKVTTRHDHPGKSNVVKGTWRFEHDQVWISFGFKIAGKWGVEESSFVPVVWGNRTMLVLDEDLLSGFFSSRVSKAMAQMRAGLPRTVADSATFVRGLTRSESAWPLPPVYGKPAVPALYRSLLEARN